MVLSFGAALSLLDGSLQDGFDQPGNGSGT